MESNQRLVGFLLALSLGLTLSAASDAASITVIGDYGESRPDGSGGDAVAVSDGSDPDNSATASARKCAGAGPKGGDERNHQAQLRPTHADPRFDGRRRRGGAGRSGSSTGRVAWAAVHRRPARPATAAATWW